MTYYPLLQVFPISSFKFIHCAPISVCLIPVSTSGHISKE